MKIGESIEVLQEMRAPQYFLERVLRRVGLLDGYALVQSPIGAVYIAAGENGITAVMEARDRADFERRYRERFGRRVERRDDLATDLERALVTHKAQVDLRSCNPFQRAVLEATRRIPEGTVRPYAWIAREIGQPLAVRAVGTALAKNPVPLVVPCHRVVRSDGETGQYALGADDKVRLLEHEGIDIPEVQRRVTARGFWAPEKSDGTFCLPYCFSSDQVRRNRFIEFRSAREALACGLQPCETCHPLLAA